MSGNMRWVAVAVVLCAAVPVLAYVGCSRDPSGAKTLMASLDTCRRVDYVYASRHPFTTDSPVFARIVSEVRAGLAAGRISRSTSKTSGTLVFYDAEDRVLGEATLYFGVMVVDGAEYGLETANLVEAIEAEYNGKRSQGPSSPAVEKQSAPHTGG
jgi:hypothetical protein